MINFTVGPVQSSDIVRKIGSEQIPYFRTLEFSEIMFENERLIKKFAYAGENSKVVFITGSGTASMEASVINAFTKYDKVLVVNGGSFGHRFVELCEIHGIPYTEIPLKYGQALSHKQLDAFDGRGYTGFIVNIHETSTGVLYDIDMISKFCRKNNLFLLVDAISSFLADSINMCRHEIDIMITGSQKALACPPGVSVIILSEKAVHRVMNNNPECMYFDLKNALVNARRGQTPFTPAVGILLQINARLREIDENGGVENEISRISAVAKDFRNHIVGLPFEIFSDSMSNAVTPVRPLTASAYDVFRILKDEYGIWICPNGGELAEKLFRVGHIGCLTKEDNNKLIEAFYDLKRRKII